MTDRPRHVLVTDAGRGSAVAFIRSLGRRGWRVTAADHDRSSPGFRSRYVTSRLLVPNAVADADAMVERILAAVRDTGVDLVVPVTDETGLPLAAARDRFAGRTVLAVPDPEALAATHDKAATLAIAEALEIPIPPTIRVDDPRTGPAAAAELGGYPIVVKPAKSRVVRPDGTIAKHTVSYATDDRTLVDALGAVEPGVTVLLQRWLPGEGVGVELLMDQGRALAAFQHRRVREVPVTGGASAFRVSEALDPVLLHRSVRLLAAIRWTGLAMVEFRRAPDGTARLMEVNGRIWGSLPLAVRAGVDFPAGLADLLLDGVVEPAPEPRSTDYRVGLRARNLRLELAWIRAVLTGRRRYPELPWPGRRAGLRAAVRLLDPRVADDLLDWSDPAPGLAQLPAMARDLLGGGASRG